MDEITEAEGKAATPLFAGKLEEKVKGRRAEAAL